MERPELVKLGESLLQKLQFNGLVHLWGLAGSGKTLLAASLAAVESASSSVEWISTDGKRSFVEYLLTSIRARGGRPENVSTTVVQGCKESINAILGLTNRVNELTSLIVVDSVTRVVDMSRNDPTLWGRDLIEVALPSLAGLADAFNLSVVLTSECRFFPGSGVFAVLHDSLKQWAEKDILLKRNPTGTYSEIFCMNKNDQSQVELGRVHFQDGVLVDVFVNRGSATNHLEVT
jgi:hypothetical protein